MNPEISIIVPVYNVEKYLGDCIDSILAQTFTSFEVILVNDGSMDRSGAICDDYAKLDRRIRVLHKEKCGVSTARNVGVNAAKGEYIGFVDSDDRIHKNMYQKLYELCTETNSDIAICKLGREINGKLINKDEEGKSVKKMDHIEAMRQLFKGVLYRFSLCNKLFKRRCFEKVKFPEGRIHEDLSTTYRLFANANKAVFTNKIGYIYVKRENSILTSRFNEKRLDAFIGWDEILLFMKKEYPQLYQEVMASFVYWCIDNVYYILDPVQNKNDRKKHLNQIQQCVRKHYKDIQKEISFSFMYRYMITLLNYNVGLLILSYSLKKFVKRVVL